MDGAMSHPWFGLLYAVLGDGVVTSHAAIHGTMFINNERVLKRGVAHNDVAGDSQVLYAGLSYDFVEYAVGIRNQICKNVPADLEGLDKVIDILLKQFLSARGQANGSQTGYLCARKQLGQAEGPCAQRSKRRSCGYQVLPG